jgi:hypothetical protein
MRSILLLDARCTHTHCHFACSVQPLMRHAVSCSSQVNEKWNTNNEHANPWMVLHMRSVALAADAAVTL